MAMLLGIGAGMLAGAVAHETGFDKTLDRGVHAAFEEGKKAPASIQKFVNPNTKAQKKNAPTGRAMAEQAVGRPPSKPPKSKKSKKSKSGREGKRKPAKSKKKK